MRINWITSTAVGIVILAVVLLSIYFLFFTHPLPYGKEFQKLVKQGDLQGVRNFLAHQKIDLPLPMMTVPRDLDEEAPDIRMTPLEIAISEGNLVIVNELLERGADPQKLELALRSSQLEILKALLARGANPNLKGKDGTTPFMVAAKNRNLNQVRLMLEYGADPSIADMSGKRAIDFACEPAQRPMVNGELLPCSKEIETLLAGNN